MSNLEHEQTCLFWSHSRLIVSPSSALLLYVPRTFLDSTICTVAVYHLWPPIPPGSGSAELSRLPIALSLRSPLTTRVANFLPFSSANRFARARASLSCGYLIKFHADKVLHDS